MDREEQEHREEVEEEDDDGDRQQEEILRPSFPTGRVKRIVKLDTDISKITSEALLLVSLSADLFLGFLAERAKTVAVEKRKRTIKLDHIRSAARRHPPTNDFLTSCLPDTEKPQTEVAKKTKAAVEDEPLPKGVQRIDGFFKKAEAIVDQD